MYTMEHTSIPEIKVLTPRRFADERGCFFEVYSEPSLQALGLVFSAVQENHIINVQASVLRGIHFQNDPHAQGKIVRCIRGVVDDYAVDLRKNSPTYLKWVKVELSEENGKQLFIPHGFGHAVISRSEYSEIQYVTDAGYCPQADRSIRYDDPEINIDWCCDAPILSAKDQSAPYLKDSDCNFYYSV